MGRPKKKVENIEEKAVEKTTEKTTEKTEKKAKATKKGKKTTLTPQQKYEKVLEEAVRLGGDREELTNVEGAIEESISKVDEEPEAQIKKRKVRKKCSSCGELIEFGKEVDIDGNLYCEKCGEIISKEITAEHTRYKKIMDIIFNLSNGDRSVGIYGCTQIKWLKNNETFPMTYKEILYTLNYMLNDREEPVEIFMSGLATQITKYFQEAKQYYIELNRARLANKEYIENIADQEEEEIIIVKNRSELEEEERLFQEKQKEREEKWCKTPLIRMEDVIISEDELTEV